LRPAAAAALPALQGSGQAPLHFGNGHANGHGHAAYAAAAKPQHPANAHMAVPIALRTAHVDESAPILPPRPTNRMDAGTPRPTTWKSWPVVVIGIAVLAIIVAVILMVWPSNGTTKADAKTLAPPPAPERMDTNPSPSTGNGPSGSVDPSTPDPWKSNPGAAPDPAPSQPSPPSVPDIDQIDPPNLSDPFRGGGSGGGGLQAALDLTNAIRKHGCDRLAACSQSDDTVKAICDLGNLALPAPKPPTCQAAQRCLAKIDTMSCDDIDVDSVSLGMFQSVQDCLEAVTRC
jgi:hypothetical protein